MEFSMKNTTMPHYLPPEKDQDKSVPLYPLLNSVNESLVEYDFPDPFPMDENAPPGSRSAAGQEFIFYGEYVPIKRERYLASQQSRTTGCGQPNCRSGPIVNQPIHFLKGNWKAMRQSIPNCPPGLECLMSLSSLFIRQRVKFLLAFTAKSNKFTIKNDKGKKILHTAEDTDLCTRLCLGTLRPLELSIRDSKKREVIRLHRPLKCSVCCFPCCLQKMEVFSPPGTLLGTIEQNWSLFYPNFSIKDAAGVTVLKIKGPLWGLTFCGFTFCGKMEFQVLSRDGQVKIGMISREWLGFSKEFLTGANFFGISFPQDLDVRMKAVMIGAVFLIDAIYYDRSD